MIKHILISSAISLALLSTGFFIGYIYFVLYIDECLR